MEPLTFPPNTTISMEMKYFLMQLLSKSPKNRLGASKGITELINHSWLRDVEWNKLINQTCDSVTLPIDRHNWRNNFQVLEDNSIKSKSSLSHTQRNNSIEGLTF